MTENEEMERLIKKAATLENAIAYHLTDEKFMFCQELLDDISAWHPKVDVWIGRLENELKRFDSEIFK